MSTPRSRCRRTIRSLHLPNVVLTPHIGWVAEESYRVFIEDVVENILAYLDGRAVPLPINPQALQNRIISALTPHAERRAPNPP